jgi:hypothetical protein
VLSTLTTRHSVALVFQVVPQFHIFTFQRVILPREISNLRKDDDQFQNKNLPDFQALCMRTSVVELLVFEPIASQVSIGVSLSRQPIRE